MIKQWLKNFLLQHGWDVMRIGSQGWHTYYLERLGFAPHTLVDVGVGLGTWGLYEVYPAAELVLIEPLVEFAPHVEKILRARRGRVFWTAVGACQQEQTIQINAAFHERSSIFDRTDLEEAGVPHTARTIPVTTLDALLAEHKFVGPFGLKIDTEGYELEVITGASKLLQQTQFVIAEVSVGERFQGGYTLADFVAVLAERGFQLCEILHNGRAANSEMTFIDAVFRRQAPL